MPAISEDQSPWQEAGTRWFLPGIKSEEILYLLQEALDQGVERIFIEAGPIIATIEPSNHRDRWIRFPPVARNGLKQLLNFRWRRDNLLSELPVEMLTHTYSFSEDEGTVRFIYQNWADNPSLEEILRRAEADGVEIVLLAYPRAQSSALSVYGEGALEQLSVEILALADHFELSVFQPTLHWPDDHFRDRSHLNWRGRQRYLSELAAWWDAQ